MPVFETEADRDRQDTLQWVLENLGFDVEQTSTLSAFDYRLYRHGRPYALVEYKARDKLWDPIKVDTQKIRQLVHAAEEFGGKPIFIVGCPGPPYHFIHAHTDYEVTTFKRERGSERRGDVESEVFMIPASEFNLL